MVSILQCSDLHMAYNSSVISAISRDEQRTIGWNVNEPAVFHLHDIDSRPDHMRPTWIEWSKLLAQEIGRMVHRQPIGDQLILL